MSYYQAGGVNPAYHGTGEKYRAETAVAMGGGDMLMGQEDVPRWSWCNAVWSLLTCLCCFCMPLWYCCAVPGLYYSVLSYSDHKAGDFERASFKRRCSWGWTLTAFILGAIFLGLIIAFFVAGPSILSTLGVDSEILCSRMSSVVWVEKLLCNRNGTVSNN